MKRRCLKTAKTAELRQRPHFRQSTVEKLCKKQEIKQIHFGSGTEIEVALPVFVHIHIKRVINLSGIRQEPQGQFPSAVFVLYDGASKGYKQD